MRCEPWMDHTPAPQKTPLQLAQDDMRYWKDRIVALTEELTVAQQEFANAVEAVNRAHSAEVNKSR